jgi:hypothetical protein
VYLTTVSYPIKGTPYYGEVADRVVSSGAWRETSDREAKIRGRHSRDYYEHADSLLKGEVELSRARKGSGTDGGTAGLEAQVVEARRGLTLTADEVES